MTRTGVGSEEPGDEPEELARWLAAGFTQDEAEGWRHGHFTIRSAQAWLAEGVEAGLEATRWRTAGVTPGSVGGWRAADIDATEAIAWHELGFSLAEARPHKIRGRGPLEAFRAEDEAPAPSPSVVRLSTGTNLSSPPSRTLGGASSLHRLGYFDHAWTDVEARRWAGYGISAPDAYLWSALGLDAATAGRLTGNGSAPEDVVREWWTAGIPFGEVAGWISAGYRATEAREHRAEGETVEEAGSPRAPEPDEPETITTSPPSPQLLGRWGPPSSTGRDLGPPPPDAAAARIEVERAYAAMLRADEAGAVQAVEGGSNLGGCLEQARDRHHIVVTGDATPAIVQVHAVRFLNDHEARVLFTVHVGEPVSLSLGPRVGQAMLAHGTWKVARRTFCDFLRIAGVACPPRDDFA